jgi:hypothetical protein
MCTGMKNLFHSSPSGRLFVSRIGAVSMSNWRADKGGVYYRVNIGLRGITCHPVVDFRTPRNDSDWRIGNYAESMEACELLRLSIEAVITNNHIRSTTHG